MGVRFLYKIAFWMVLICFASITLYFAYIGVQKMVYPLKFQEDVNYYSKLYELDKGLVYSVIKVESDFVENAVSSKGAKGLMQITDKTASYIADLKNDSSFDMFNANQNIEYGCYYLRYLIDKFFDIETVLCAYNAGEGKVRSWLKDSKYSSDGITLDYIEYTETREYVNKIKNSLIKYKKLYGNLLDKR